MNARFKFFPADETKKPVDSCRTSQTHLSHFKTVSSQVRTAGTTTLLYGVHFWALWQEIQHILWPTNHELLAIIMLSFTFSFWGSWVRICPLWSHENSGSQTGHKADNSIYFFLECCSNGTFLRKLLPQIPWKFIFQNEKCDVLRNSEQKANSAGHFASHLEMPECNKAK